MKTLSEIKSDIAVMMGYLDWEDCSVNISFLALQSLNDEVTKAFAKECLNEAAERAEVRATDIPIELGGGVHWSVDEDSILSILEEIK